MNNLDKIFTISMTRLEVKLAKMQCVLYSRKKNNLPYEPLNTRLVIPKKGPK